MLRGDKRGEETREERRQERRGDKRGTEGQRDGHASMIFFVFINDRLCHNLRRRHLKKGIFKDKMGEGWGVDGRAGGRKRGARK